MALSTQQRALDPGRAFSNVLFCTLGSVQGWIIMLWVLWATDTNTEKKWVSRLLIPNNQLEPNTLKLQWPPLSPSYRDYSRKAEESTVEKEFSKRDREIWWLTWDPWIQPVLKPSLPFRTLIQETQHILFWFKAVWVWSLSLKLKENWWMKMWGRGQALGFRVAWSSI